jgi:hypothetical protein
MIKDWPTRLIRKMLMGMHRGMTDAAQQELKVMLDDLARGILDPSRIAEFARAMGIDISQLTGMMGQGKVPGFDPYQVLGLDKSASDEEVKEAYRELVNKYHTDKSGTPKTKFAFQMVLAAFELIKRERGWQ